MSDRGMGYQDSPHMSTMGDIQQEVVAAREKFPDGKLLLAALMEEVGELAQALLQGKSFSEIRAEAKQVACVAIRIMEEGESSFPESVKQVRTEMVRLADPVGEMRKFVSWKRPRKRRRRSEAGTEERSQPAPKLVEGEG